MPTRMNPDNHLRVIGAGFGRTGTASLKIALERLGFGPCHHMAEVFRHPGQATTWEAAGRGARVDWRSFLRGWGSAVDFPAAFYYRELMAAFPDAKVVLTVRDPDAWYDSFSATILPLFRRFPMRQIVPWLPMINLPIRVTNHPKIRELLYADRDRAIELFKQNTAEVQRLVPPDRLLIYEVKQGWEPLCRFLEVPVPDEPFPRVNDTRAFQRRNAIVSALCWLILLSPVLIVALAARAFMSGRR